MPESKQDAEVPEAPKPRKKIKATTGAWWKSTVEVEDQAEAAKPEDSSPEKSPDQSEEKRRRPSRRGRRGGRKKTKAAEGASPESRQTPSGPEAEEGPDKPGDGADKPQQREQQPAHSGRKSRGRRGGKKKTASQGEAEVAAKSKDQAGGDGAAGASPAGSSTEHQAETGGKEPVVKLLINAEEPEECRLALLENGRLESIHVSTVGKVQTRNNIYKARIVSIEPNLQAAFIDYGTDKNGFLPFSEIHPEYYKQQLKPEIQKLVETHQWKKLNISDVMERGQELLVQVVKEEVGKKGANMTTYLSLPGRCVVLMPGSDSEGISRRISGEERRNQLREVMNSLNIPEGIGWIVRTASIDITKTALSRDVKFLLKLWKEIKAKGQHLQGVGLLYQDYNCVMRFLREYYDPCIQEILVDSEEALEKVRDFVEMLPAKQRQVKVRQHRGARPIFNQYSVEDQIESIYQPRVSLPSGGSIVIDATEALVAIDVNSGSTGKNKNFEETIFQANIEAAEELARQLRLRDLGGLIVVDFIDMRSNKNIREVEKQVKAAMKRDKAKVDISRISRFGLMQISRQKLGAPIESGNYKVCEYCRGRGTVRSVETQSLFYFRRIHTGASRRQVTRVECRFPLDVAEYLLNNKRHELMELEEKYQTRVVITADPGLKPSEHEITFVKSEAEEGGKKQA